MTAPASTQPYQPYPDQQKRTTWSGGRIALVLFSAVFAVLAAICLTGGGYALWADNQRDDAGYLTSTAERFDTDSYALSAGTLDISGGGPDALIAQDLLGSVRISVAGADSGQDVFVGIAPADTVEEYLAGVDHDVLEDVDVSPFQASYRPQPGDAAPEPPTEQSFWAATASGSGPQTLTWEVQAGDWSVVVMNSGGSSGVHADISVGATLPIVTTLALWLLIAGGVLLLIAIALFVPAVVRRRN